MNPSGRAIPPKEVIENLPRVRVTVSGAAGDGACCNGEYVFFRKDADGTSYQRLVEEGGEVVRYMVYRCPMRGKEFHYWFISKVPPNREHGSNYDMDFYSTLSSFEPRLASYTEDVVPPETNWQQMKTTQKAPSNVHVKYTLMSEDGNEEDEIVEAEL